MSMAERDGWIWMDGDFCPWQEAKVHVLTHGLHYGSGVFEGLRIYKTAHGPAIFRLRDHTRRFFASAKILGMKIPFDENTLLEAQVEVVRKNRLESGYLRPIAFFGSDKMGVSAIGNRVCVSIACWPWSAYLGEEALEKGIRVKTSSYRRVPVDCLHPRAKATGMYLQSVLAKHEALSAGYDEALFLDHEGFVAEGSGENLFVVSEGRLYTPSLGPVLRGITRDTVAALAQEMGLSPIETRLTVDDIYSADEAFFTGTAAEITPMRELDGREIGAGKPGDITRALQGRYFACVHGEMEEHLSWLSFVGESNGKS